MRLVKGDAGEFAHEVEVCACTDAHLFGMLYVEHQIGAAGDVYGTEFRLHVCRLAVCELQAAVFHLQLTLLLVCLQAAALQGTEFYVCREGFACVVRDVDVAEAVGDDEREFRLGDIDGPVRLNLSLLVAASVRPPQFQRVGTGDRPLHYAHVIEYLFCLGLLLGQRFELELEPEVFLVPGQQNDVAELVFQTDVCARLDLVECDCSLPACFGQRRACPQRGGRKAQCHPQEAKLFENPFHDGAIVFVVLSDWLACGCSGCRVCAAGCAGATCRRVWRTESSRRRSFPLS